MVYFFQPLTLYMFVHHRLTERFNKTLTTHLMKVVNAEGDNWDEHIDSILFGYRVNRQASTKISPFELLYGVKPRLPIDLDDVDCDADEANSAESRHERVKHLAESLVDARREACDNIKAAQAKQKERFDLKPKASSYAVGDKVLRYNRRRDTRMGGKLEKRFAGPFVVAEVLGRGVYRLEKDGVILKQCANASNLKPWIEPVSVAESKASTPAFCMCKSGDTDVASHGE